MKPWPTTSGPSAWNARALHRFFDLADGDYKTRDIVRAGESLASATLAGISVAFDPPALP